MPRPSDPLVVTIYDSAPSRATAHDIQKVFRRMRLQPPHIVCHARQPRDSNECGLHVIHIALTRALNAQALPSAHDSPYAPYMSLHHWRSRLADTPRLNEQRARTLLDDALRPPPTELQGGGLPAQTISIPREEKPLQPPASRSTTVIDVDATHTPISREMLKRQGITGTTIDAWFEAAANAANEQDAGDFKKVSDEFKSLRPEEQARRAAEFRKRMQRHRFTADTATAFLRAAPPSLREDEALWKRIQDAASKILSTQVPPQETKDGDTDRSVLACYAPGSFVTDNIIERALCYFPRTETWTIIGPAAFALYANTGRLTNIPSIFHQRVAAITFHGAHFTLLTFTNGIVEHRDSLHPGCVADGQTQRIIGRFRQLLHEQKFYTEHKVRLVPCAKQQNNDCALEAINNLALVALGERGKLSRGLLKQLHDDPAPWQRKDLWKSIWPQRPSHAGLINTASAATSFKADLHAMAAKQQLPQQQQQQLLRQPCHQTERPQQQPQRQPQQQRSAIPSAPKATAPQHGVKIPVPPRHQHQQEPVPAPLPQQQQQKQHQPQQQHPRVVPPAMKVTALPIRSAPSPKALPLPQEQTAPRLGTARAQQIATGICERNQCTQAAVVDTWCLQHHPHILALRRPKCTALAQNKRCKRPALTLAHVLHCLGHATEAEQTRVAAALRGNTDAPTPTPSGTHQPYASVLPVAAPTRSTNDMPLPHASIISATTAASPGSVLDIDLDDKTHGRTSIRAQVVRAPVPGVIGEIATTHRYCKTCQEWHSGVDEPMALPELGTNYFAIAAARGSIVNTSAPCTTMDIGEEEDGEEAPAEPADFDKLRTVPVPGLEADRHCIGDCIVNNPLASSVSSAKSWFIYNGKPPHVHNIAWSKLSQATRKLHAKWLHRLRSLPPDLAKETFPRAVIEVTLRLAQERRWSWPTISSELSSAASALRDLHFHTLQREGIDLHKDPYFEAASTRAQRLARIASLHPRKSESLSRANFLTLGKQLAGHPSWYLLQLAWYLAGRVGDIRQLQPQNINIGNDIITGTNHVRTRACFVEGKGATFWGPYTIHSTLPEDIAKPLRAFLAAQPQARHAFSTVDQAMLSSAVKKLPDHSLRSIRRGSLIYLSALGVTDEELMRVSGHKRKETLMRYLGWGRESGDSAREADKRARIVTATDESANSPSDNEDRSDDEESLGPSGGDEEGDDFISHHPMWTGRHSGFNGVKGRRVRPPPRLFSYQAPSSADLGIDQAFDTSDWPLHVKDVRSMDLRALTTHVEDPELNAALQKGLAFLQDPTLYGVDWTTLAPSHLPYARYTPHMVQRMLEVGKIVPLPGDKEIRSAVKGFPAPNHAKQYLRPVFEPLYNSKIHREQLPPLGYLPDRQKRLEFASCAYRLDFDFQGWYDQHTLDPATWSHHVLRVKEPVEWPIGSGKRHTLFCLTREPMGATWAAHSAQSITWAILEPVLRTPGVFVGTMIDNVGIGADDADSFAGAVLTFLQRCDQVGAQLNDADTLPRTREDIIAAGRKAAREPLTWLGVTYEGHAIKNSDRCVEKLNVAWDRMRRAALGDTTIIITRRHIASLIGLCIWMMKVSEISLCHHFAALKLFMEMEAYGGWDDPVRVTSDMLNVLGSLVHKLLENEPITPQPSPLPSANLDDYDAVMFADASGKGYGGFASVQGHTFELRGGHGESIRNSAWSEPLGATKMLRWLHDQGAHRIAVVTDHFAMARGQRRPISGNHGFSTSFYLNLFFAELYAPGCDGQVFFIPGEINPADAPSRYHTGYAPLQVFERTDLTLPPLASLHHPYVTAPDRPWWCR